MFYSLLFVLLGSLTAHHQLFSENQKIALPDVFSKANEKKRIVKSLISKHKTQRDSIITDNEWKELEGDYFLSLMDRTQTALGPWALREHTTPIINKNKLEQRQRELQLLFSDLRLFAELKQQLAELANYEDAILAYYNPQDELNKNAERLYYSIFKSHLNANKIALEGAYAVDVSKVFMMIVGTLCLNGALQYTFSQWLKNESISFKSFLNGTIEGFKEPIRIHNVNYEQFLNPELRAKCAENRHEWTSAFIMGSAGDQWALVSDWISNYCTNGLVSGGLAAAFVGLKVISSDVNRYMTLKKSGQELLFLFNTSNHLQQRLSQVSKIFQIAQDITVLCQDHPEINQTEEFEIIKQHSYACPQLSKNVQQLIDLLATSTFSNHAGYVYSRGRVLLAQKLLISATDDLLELLFALAALDARVSVATVVHEYKSNGKPFAWAQFTNDNTPYIRFESAWNPLINKNSIIRNDICFGNNVAEKVIITGPNGGGKSSTMKTAAWAIILAQSWAVVPATKAELSLFTQIKTSLHPQESIKEGLSSFMAEKKRMQELEAAISSKAAHEVQLFLIDEPYHGTVEFEASKRVYDFGTRIASCSCLMMIATHLEKPVSLEAETKGKFINYSMGYSQDELGQIKRTFKFVPGAADWWFKDSNKRSQFIDSLEFN